MSTQSTIVPPSELDATTVGAMFELMTAYYDNVRKQSFLDDLYSKDSVICLRNDESGQLVGFSTQRLLTAEVEGQTRRVLFSGDTIVDRRHWNSPALAQAWGRFALELIDRFAGEPMYWLLFSKGYRTYRFLPLFFHQYAPAIDREAPQGWKEILHSIVHGLHGEGFDDESGVLSGAAINNYRLRSGVGAVTPERQQDAHVQFFLSCNPGHGQGDELCCIAPLSRENFTRAAWRVIGE